MNSYESNQKQESGDAGMKGAMVRGAARKGQALLADFTLP